MWIFEPHVAENVFEAWIKEQIPVVRDEWLDRGKGLRMERRASLDHDARRQDLYRRMFIDATYEGDLMAAAGVDYHVGREAIKSTARSGTACRPACCTTGIISAC
jgi:hypothetical protein